MIAKYPGTCQYCETPIVPGDEIVRGNGSRRYSVYAHVSCKPASGVSTRAAWVVDVIEGDERGWIPVGIRKRYVRQGMADALATQLRDLGAKRVEVRPA